MYLKYDKIHRFQTPGETDAYFNFLIIGRESNLNSWRL